MPFETTVALAVPYTDWNPPRRIVPLVVPPAETT